MQGKIFKKIKANNSKSYLSYLNKLVDESTIGEKPSHTNYSALTEEIETNPRLPKIKFSDRVRVTKHKNILTKRYTKNGSKKLL